MTVEVVIDCSSSEWYIMLYYVLTEMQYHCAALQKRIQIRFFRQIDFDNSAKFLIVLGTFQLNFSWNHYIYIFSMFCQFVP